MSSPTSVVAMTGTSLSVQSLDGTLIGYTQYGTPNSDRPGILLIQGAMATSTAYTTLALHLSTRFTVYTPDRRGRGASPKEYESAHDIGRDVEDVEAVLRETGASYVFGLSSGAIITLEAARRLDRITRAAVFEPPFYPPYPPIAINTDSDNTLPGTEAGIPLSREGIRQLNAAVERGDYSSALQTAVTTAQTAPPILSKLPSFLTHTLASIVLRIDSYRNQSKPTTTLRALLPGIRYDFNVVAAMDGRMATLSAINKPVLLMSGSASREWLRHSVRVLASVIPNARCVELDGASHVAPWNGGKPQQVASALIKFFIS